MWAPELLLPPNIIMMFGPKTAIFVPKYASLGTYRPCQLIWCPFDCLVGWLTKTPPQRSDLIALISESLERLLALNNQMTFYSSAVTLNCSGESSRVDSFLRRGLGWELPWSGTCSMCLVAMGMKRITLRGSSLVFCIGIKWLWPGRRLATSLSPGLTRLLFPFHLQLFWIFVRPDEFFS